VFIRGKNLSRTAATQAPFAIDFAAQKFSLLEAILPIRT
jgi:hypothetical protein